MTKIEYLKKLKRALKQVKSEERKKSLDYFSEVIDDRIGDGISEEAAVAELESVEDAAACIIAEAREQGQLKPHRSAWEIALIVLGFPLWFPLLLTVAIVVLTMYIVVWILIGVLFITSISLVLGGAAAIFGLFFATSFPAGLACLGSGLACAGIGIALFVPAAFFAHAFAKATPVLWNKLINRKEV